MIATLSINTTSINERINKMDRLKFLLNKYGHIYNEEEAIEVEFRHRMEGRKLPKDIGYNADQNKRYLKIYEQLDSGKINEGKAVADLTILMEEYYGLKYI